MKVRGLWWSFGLIALSQFQYTVAGLLSSITGLSSNPDDVKFYYFNNAKDMNNYTEIKYGDVASLRGSGYLIDRNHATFVIHGFLSTAFNLPYPRNVIQAYLRKGVSSNYIAVDWSKLGTPMFNDPLLYPIAAGNTGIVGQRIGEFIRFLMDYSAISGPENVHLVGHSLGSHVSSRVGYYMKFHNLPLLQRISGLDPAGPGFQYIPYERRLDSADASFVDTYHTSLTFGYIGDVGHLSFYPNHGGPFQPHCDTLIDPVHLLGICAHNKVGEYFAYSILNNTIPAYKCSDAWYDLCNPNTSDQVIFGEFTDSTARGSYYLEIATTEADLKQ